MPLVNSGDQSNFSRSHEYAPHINAFKRHPGDASTLSPFCIRARKKSYAQSHAAITISDRLTRGGQSAGTAAHSWRVIIAKIEKCIARLIAVPRRSARSFAGGTRNGSCAL